MDEQPDVDGEREGTAESLAAEVEVAVRRGVAESERLPVELDDTEEERHNEGVGDTVMDIDAELLVRGEDDGDTVFVITDAVALPLKVGIDVRVFPKIDEETLPDGDCDGEALPVRDTDAQLVEDGVREATTESLAVDDMLTVRRGVAESERLPVELGETDDDRQRDGVAVTDNDVLADTLIVGDVVSELVYVAKEAVGDKLGELDVVALTELERVILGEPLMEMVADAEGVSDVLFKLEGDPEEEVESE
jgi:hypothetical protein